MELTEFNKLQDKFLQLFKAGKYDEAEKVSQYMDKQMNLAANIAADAVKQNLIKRNLPVNW